VGLLADRAAPAVGSDNDTGVPDACTAEPPGAANVTSAAADAGHTGADTGVTGAAAGRAAGLPTVLCPGTDGSATGLCGRHFPAEAAAVPAPVPGSVPSTAAVATAATSAQAMIGRRPSRLGDEAEVKRRAPMRHPPCPPSPQNSGESRFADLSAG